MDNRSQIDMQRTGEVTVEKHTITLRLFGDDERQFLQDPKEFLEAYFKHNGEHVRKLTVHVRNPPDQRRTANAEMRIDRLHIISPADEASYMWVEIDF